MFTARTLAIAAGLIVVALTAGSLLNQQIGGLGSDPKAKPLPDPSIARVERVIDGDTIRVRFVSGAARRVRYIGIDSPELRGDTECYAKAAVNRNAELVGGERVKLVYDRERKDLYGRLLAYVYRARDGRFINADLIADGFATPLTVPPNVAHASELRRLARIAREERRGLWGSCAL